MFWNFGRVDKINELLNKEGVTLDEILDEDSFSSSVRSSSNQKLFDFLIKDENMTELLKYALTDEYKDKPKYTKFANASVTVFSASRSFQQIFLNNELFKAKLKEFTTSVAPSSRTCGHYQRIIESIANGTKGQILGELTNFTDFLINNITDMALKDLFVLMATEFTDSFGFNTDLIIKLVTQINDENGLFVVSAIREIMKTNSKDMNEKVFDSDNFIDNLFKITVEKTKSNPLLATELLRLVQSFNDCKNYNQILQKYQQNYEYSKNLSLPFQVQVFNQLNPDIFDSFFDPQSCSLLVEAIYNSFMNKTKEEKADISKSCNLRSKSIEFFEKSITNARVSDISKELYEIFKDSPDADQAFNEFFETKVVNHIELRESKYGGKVVDDDDDEYEDEDENDEDGDDDDDDDGIKKMSFNTKNDDDDSFDSDSFSNDEEIDKSSDDDENLNIDENKIDEYINDKSKIKEVEEEEKGEEDNQNVDEK